MVNAGGDNARVRKDKTLIAHRVLLKFDERDMSGQVTFHFQKGVGIVKHEIHEFVSWSAKTTNENNVLVYNVNL